MMPAVVCSRRLPRPGSGRPSSIFDDAGRAREHGSAATRTPVIAKRDLCRGRLCCAQLNMRVQRRGRADELDGSPRSRSVASPVPRLTRTGDRIPRREKRARDVPPAGRTVRHCHRAQPPLRVGVEPSEHRSPDWRVRDFQPRAGPGDHHRRHRSVGRIGVRPARRAAVDDADRVARRLARGGDHHARARRAPRRDPRMADYAPGAAAIHRHVVRPAPLSRCRGFIAGDEDERFR